MATRIPWEGMIEWWSGIVWKPSLSQGICVFTCRRNTCKYGSYFQDIKAPNYNGGWATLSVLFLVKHHFTALCLGGRRKRSRTPTRYSRKLLPNLITAEVRQILPWLAFNTLYHSIQVNLAGRLSTAWANHWADMWQRAPTATAHPASHTHTFTPCPLLHCWYMPACQNPLLTSDYCLPYNMVTENRGLRYRF